MPKPLSKRETEVLALLADGLTETEIASQLRLSYDTVKSHSKRVRVKLEAKNQTHSVAIGFRTGILTLPREDSNLQQTP